MVENVLIVACKLKGENDDSSFEYSLEELEALVETAGGELVGTVTQAREKVNPATYIGKGKIEEVSALVDETGADVVVFNDELTGGQVRNIQSEVGCKVIDRTQMILDIFAKRARTKEGKIQVELAQLSYLLPRLTGQGQALSRLGGGIGTRGPGETKLETDRRHIQKRMDDLSKQLESVKDHRESYRKNRKRNRVVQFALVGYTNAGKSTLLQKLTGSETFQEDLLFATLDPLTRQFELPSGYPALISDTVGFIQDLPTALIASFRSTLEEVKEADIIIHVVDASHQNAINHINTVDKHLKELGASHLPQITVFNKIDKVNDRTGWVSPHRPSLTISAFSEQDLQRLKVLMEDTLKKEMEYFHLFIPVAEGHVVAALRKQALIIEENWDDGYEGYRIKGYALSDHPIQGVISTWKVIGK